MSLPQMKVIENGKLQYTEKHESKGITPEMMRYYQTQHGTHRTKETYKMWHPDHLDFKILRKPETGNIGAVYWCKERVGKYIVTFKTIVEDSTDTTTTVLHKHPLYHCRNHMVRESTPTGQITHATLTIGSDNPVWGRLWNFITRKFIFTENLREAHAKHADEEFENMQNNVKKLWAEHTNKED